MTGQEPRDELRSVLSRPLAEHGLDLEGVEISTVGRRRLVRVLVDRDGGVSLDEVAAATRVVGELLDGSDALGDTPYTLEVTSPGVDRPLSAPRHWRRNVDRLVRVTGRHGDTVTGRIVEAGEDAATLDVAGQRRTLSYDDVATARVEVEFKPRAREAG